MQLAPGLHRIGNDLVAVHLIATDDVRGVVLTHADSDHIGFAERLRAEHGVRVYVHEADADRARGEKPPKTGREAVRLGPTLAFLGHFLRRGGLRPRPLREVVEVRDGDVLDLPGAPRVIALPGHSPGSIALHVPAVDALFVGDGLTTRSVLTGQTGAQPAPFTDDRELARASLDALDGLSAAWVLPGHGAPWTAGVDALLRDLRRPVR